MSLNNIRERFMYIGAELCKKNPDIVQIIFEDLDNSTISDISFNENAENYTELNFSININGQSYNCSLEFNSDQFKYTRRQHTAAKENIYLYYSAAKHENKFAFYQEEIGVRGIGLSSKNIRSRNSFEIHSDIEQLYAEQNDVFLACSPVPEVQERLSKTKQNMKVTNKHALSVLKKLRLSPENVERNRCSHTELWPLKDNNLVELLDPESINFDDESDRWFNNPSLSVGKNNYASPERLMPGKMINYQSPEEKSLASSYINNAIDINELKEKAFALLTKYMKNRTL